MWLHQCGCGLQHVADRSNVAAQGDTYGGCALNTVLCTHLKVMGGRSLLQLLYINQQSAYTIQHSAGQLVCCKPLLRCATAVSLLLFFVCEVPVACQQAACAQAAWQHHAAQPCSLNLVSLQTRCHHILPLHKQPPIECTNCPTSSPMVAWVQADSTHGATICSTNRHQQPVCQLLLGLHHHNQGACASHAQLQTAPCLVRVLHSTDKQAAHSLPTIGS